MWLHDAGVEEVPEQIWASVGCEECRNTGYRGRTAAHEVFVMDDEIRLLLSGDTAMDEIETAAEAKYTPIFRDAAQKALEGITDVKEAMRIFRRMEG